jgi:hypothetical protein
MNIQALTDDGLVDIENISESTRVFFLISDEITEIDDQVSPIELEVKRTSENESRTDSYPFIGTIDDKHYFSFNFHMVSDILFYDAPSGVSGESDLTMKSIKVSTHGGGHVAYGSFARYIHANNNFLWISNHQVPTGETPIFDLRQANESNNFDDIVHLGNFVTWGGAASSAQKDPILNVEDTNIFTIADPDDWWYKTFDISSFIDHIDADPDNLNDVLAIDTDNMKSNFLFTYGDPSNGYGYTGLGIDPIVGKSVPGDGSVNPNPAQLGNCLYTIDNTTYTYLSCNFGGGKLIVGSFSNNDVSSHTWTFFNDTHSLDTKNSTDVNFLCRMPHIVRNDDKVYLYLIDDLKNQCLIYRIDDDPSGLGYYKGEKTPIFTSSIIACDVLESAGENIFCSVPNSSSYDSANNVNLQTFYESKSSYAGINAPTFYLTDTSDAENPETITAVWMNLFSSPPENAESDWVENDRSGVAQSYYSGSEELLIFVAWNSNEVIFVDIADPSNPIPRKKLTLDRTYQDSIDNTIERLTGSGNFIYILAGASSTKLDIEFIAINISNLGNELRSSNEVVEYDDTNFIVWNKS